MKILIVTQYFYPENFKSDPGDVETLAGNVLLWAGTP